MAGNTESQIIDMSGRRFGRLVVQTRRRFFLYGNTRRIQWLCKCDCGKKKWICGQSMRNGVTKSCGCLHLETVRRPRIHGESMKTKEYKTWAAMKQRCANIQSMASYKNYYGRGIRIWPRWLQSYEAFRDYVRDNLGECPEGFTLDRIDNDGNYEPGNIRWASRATQNANKRVKNGFSAAAVMVFLTACLGASASEIRLTQGQSIDSGIANCVPTNGCTGVIVPNYGATYAKFTLNKPIYVRGENMPTVKASSPGSGSGASIQSSDCEISGLRFEDFADGVANWGSTKRNNVKVLNFYIGNVGYGVVATGDNWLIKNGEINRVRQWSPGNDANAIWNFGNGAIIDNVYFHGTKLGDGVSQSDICPAGMTAYDAGPCAHVDFYQSYTNGPAISTKNVTITNCYATDTIDFIYLTDEDSGAVEVGDFTIKNNVFIGTKYRYKDANTPIEDRWPAWGIAFSYGTGGTGLQIIENNLLYQVTLAIRLNNNTKARLAKNIYAGFGQGITIESNTMSNVTIPDGGNLWFNPWSYQVVAQPNADKQAGCVVVNQVCTSDPRFVAISNPLGADGKPWTADDGWVSQVAGFGPQLAVTPAPTPTPEPPVEGDVLTPGQAAEVQQMIDAAVGPLTARVKALEDWKAQQPKTRRDLRSWDGKRVWGRVEP